MYKKKTSAQLKQAARGIMMGKYRNAISILLASDLIVSTLSLFTTTNTNSYTGILIGILINFIIVLFGTILTVGQCSFYLNIACNGPYQFSDLFTGFKVHPDKTIITQLIIQVLTTLPMIPGIGLMFYSFRAYNIIVEITTAIKEQTAMTVITILHTKKNTLGLLILTFTLYHTF